MKIKEIKNLKPKDHIFHRYYGEVEVVEVVYDSFNRDLFGLVILPVTLGGMERFMSDLGLSEPMPLLESKYRLLSPLMCEAKNSLKEQWGETKFNAVTEKLSEIIHSLNPESKITKDEFMTSLNPDCRVLFEALEKDRENQK